MKNLTKIQRKKFETVFTVLTDKQITFNDLEELTKLETKEEKREIYEYIRFNKNSILLILETIKILTPTLIDTIIDKIIEYLNDNY
jgi:hypothetical protein